MQIILTEKEKLEIFDKFISKVVPVYLPHMADKKGLAQCWHSFSTQKTVKGYPFTIYKNVKFPANRFMVEYFTNDNLFPNWNALHKCDNPHCINPTHLYAGTSKQNAEDRKKAGTQITGQKKISGENLKKVKLFTGTLNQAARKFDVHISTINKIKLRKNQNYGFLKIIPLKAKNFKKKKIAKDLLRNLSVKTIAEKYNVAEGTVFDVRHQVKKHFNINKRNPTFREMI